MAYIVKYLEEIPTYNYVFLIKYYFDEISHILIGFIQKIYITVYFLYKSDISL